MAACNYMALPRVCRPLELLDWGQGVHSSPKACVFYWNISRTTSGLQIWASVRTNEPNNMVICNRSR